MDPYLIFPPELWEKIFNLVEDPQDKLSLMRSHPKLQNQFQEKEEELLFLSALPLILDNLECSGRQIQHSERQQQRELFLKCRSLSSSSCRVVDKWMESFWKKSEGAHQPPSFLARAFGGGQPFGLMGERLAKFTEDFANHPENRTPLLSRYVTALIPTDEPELEFRNELARFYRKVGRHLKMLKVYFITGGWEIRLSSLHLLRSVLELTPNLRSLSLEFWPPCFNHITGVNQQQLQFPELPQLDHLVLSWCDHRRLLLNAFASIREYFPQLVELEIRDIRNFQDDYLENVGLFPNLKTLKLERSSGNCWSYELWEPKLRRICGKIRAPKLTLFEVNFGRSGVPGQKQVERLTKHFQICLNNLNEFYSQLEPGFQWTGCFVVSEDGSKKIKLSRKLK